MMGTQYDSQQAQKDANRSIYEQKMLAQPMGPPPLPPPQPPPRPPRGKREQWFMVSALLVVLVLVLALVSMLAVQIARRPATQATPTPAPTVAATAPTPTPAPTRASTSTPAPPAGSWTMVPSPDPGTAFNQLNGVAALSSINIWAAGFSINNGGTAQTLIEHWNGSNWQAVSSPNVGTYNYLYGVAALSSTDIWAVGYSQNSSGRFTLIEHFWNGSWQVVASPNAGTGSSQLTGVSALSATNIWAVGYSGNGNNANRQTLIEHWNGTSWQIVSSPDPGAVYNVLSGITALSATNIWAVGYSTNSSGISQTLSEHWNGNNWQVVASPNVGAFGNELNAMAVVSPNDIWAVGAYAPRMNGVTWTLIEHWNGTRWQVVSSPSPDTTSNSLTYSLSSVAAVSPTNLWAVGAYTNSMNGATRTLIEHWNGSAWTVASSPNGGTGNSLLNGVVALSSINLWAVGTYASGSKTLIEQYS